MRRSQLIWCALAAAIGVPLAAAAMSPQLAYRHPVYIAAGFAGVIALCLLLVQPLLIGGLLPGLPGGSSRRAHRLVGSLIVLAVVVHVAALWITSPPDVLDALLFQSPTAFSPWGVIAMWILFAVGLLAAMRRVLRITPKTWRAVHSLLALAIVVATVVHAMLIDGTMETFSKAALSALVLGATFKIVAGLRLWSMPVARR